MRLGEGKACIWLTRGLGDAAAIPGAAAARRPTTISHCWSRGAKVWLNRCVASHPRAPHLSLRRSKAQVAAVPLRDWQID